MVVHEMEQHDDMETDDASFQRMLQQRKSLVYKLWSYCHTNLINNTRKKKQQELKLIYILRFVENAISYSGNDETPIQFIQDCISLLESTPTIELVRQSLMTLSSCFECQGEMSKVASTSMAFLLQNRPKDATVFAVYAKCLMGCMEHMLRTTEESTSQILVLKLLPNLLKSMLHLCDACPDNDNVDTVDACIVEFNRLTSRIMPVITLAIQDKNHELHRVACETVPNCLPIFQSTLQIQYRRCWGSILSGGYATFTTSLAVALLQSEEGGVQQSHVQSMVLALLRLRNDVEKDGMGRTAVEYATSTVIRGMGLELFLTLVDFVEDDLDENKGLGSSSTTIGGGIRDDRAWLLPLMKQSAPLLATESNMAMPVFGESITTKTHLSFFQGRVLNLARRCDAASADGHRTVAEASIQKSRVVELWALFPAFCLYPMDMKENFAVVAKTVVKALGDYTRYPKLIVSELVYLFNAY
jgi:hypothetical protein